MIPVANLTIAFGESHVSGKIICLVLFVGSIFAWSTMVTKIRHLRRASRESRRFLVAYRSGAHPLAVFSKRQSYKDSPLCIIYEKTCEALGALLEARGVDAGDLLSRGTASSTGPLAERQLETIGTVARRVMADEALDLERNMGLLATAVTAAPFLGLLGTVWGVMVAFGNIRGSGSAMLPEVAPGISGALLTTVVGLLVALPSSIGYNIIAAQIRELRVRMDGFASEFMSDLENRFAQEE